MKGNLCPSGEIPKLATQDHAAARPMPPSGRMVPASIVIAGLLIAAAILFVGRWEIAVGPVAAGSQPYLLDRWTGAIFACNARPARREAAFLYGFGLSYKCNGLPTDEQAFGPAPR